MEYQIILEEFPGFEYILLPFLVTLLNVTITLVGNVLTFFWKVLFTFP